MKLTHIFGHLIKLQRGKWQLIKNYGGLSLGKRVVFEKFSECSVFEKGTIKLDDKCVIRKNSRIVSVGGELKIGKNCYFNINTNIVCRHKVTIGSKCSFGPGVTVYDHDHKFGKNGLEPGYNCKEISIGDNCWVGANVIILKGTHIGNNCVIGAGCVVSGDIPDNTLVTQNRELILKELK